MAKSRKPSYLQFESATYPWQPGIDYRAHPELYRVGKGEQGVLICEPYKNELAPHWRFRTPEIARANSQAIFGMFEAYLRAGEFVGADLARKFLQMGYTRARRHTNYKDGLMVSPHLPTQADRRRVLPGSHLACTRSPIAAVRPRSMPSSR